MAYEPHTWTSGEVVTAQKMNALEQGAAQGGGVVVHAEYDESTGNTTITDMTAGELWSLVSTGTLVVVLMEFETGGSVDFFTGAEYDSSYDPPYTFGTFAYAYGAATADANPTTGGTK